MARKFYRMSEQGESPFWVGVVWERFPDGTGARMLRNKGK